MMMWFQFYRKWGVRQRPKRKHTDECSPICKSYWAHLNFLTVTDNMLQDHWESVNGQSKTVQIDFPSTKLKVVESSMEVLQEDIWL
jgi:hypothetical protein